MTASHQRQSSHPPPYESYTYHDDDSVSPTTNTSPQPYLNNQSIYQILPHYASLPAFNSPPKYSRRLRRLVETRPKSLFLTLQIPQQQTHQLAVVSLDEKSAHSASANLIPGLPCDEESQYTHHHYSQRRRRSSTGHERELSWWTFAGLAAILFMVVASCSVFVGWSTGLFEGNGGLVTHMRISHSSVTTIWGTSESEGSRLGDVYKSRVETLRTEGYLVGEEGQHPKLGKVRTTTRLPHSDVKESAREEVHRRSARPRRGGQ